MNNAKIKYEGNIVECILKSKNKRRQDILECEQTFEMFGTQELYEFVQRHGNNLTIFGDCDVDGLSSVAIAQKFLEEFYEPNYVISSRSRRGFVEQDVAFIKSAYPETTGILTVDCGTNAIQAVEFARKNNIEVFVTDHHNPAENLPKTKIINPKLVKDAYFNEFCGAGVIYLALSQIYGHNYEAIQYAAIATIADVVPLVSDNRWLYNAGLSFYSNENMRNSELASFLKHGGINFTDEKDVGWRIAPLVNSGSRMDATDVAYNAYVLGDKDATIQLKEINSQRKTLVKSIVEDNQDKIVVSEYAVSLVVSKAPGGIVGLIGSSLSSKYKKPSIVITESTKSGSGLYAASLRGYGCVDFLDWLRLREIKITGGGHDGAAGMTFYMSPEEMSDIFHMWYEKNYQNYSYQILEDTQADIEISLTDAVLTLAEKESLKPFGNGFEEPVYLTRNVFIEYAGITGGGYNKYIIAQDEAKVVCYDYNDLLAQFKEKSMQATIAYTIEYNTFVRAPSISPRAVGPA